MVYNKKDFDTDVEYLQGFNMTKQEAKEFVQHIINEVLSVGG